MSQANFLWNLETNTNLKFNFSLELCKIQHTKNNCLYSSFPKDYIPEPYTPIKILNYNLCLL